MRLKFINFIKLIFPSDWRGVMVRLRDNYKLTHNFSTAFKIALKEKINVVGRLDYQKAEILMDLSSYKQIRRLRASKKEPETVEWIEENIKPGEIFYDIGANVGAYSFVAWAHTGKKCKVYSFEPSFSTFAALSQNVFLNSASEEIIALQISLSYKTFFIPF